MLLARASPVPASQVMCLISPFSLTKLFLEAWNSIQSLPNMIHESLGHFIPGLLDVLDDRHVQRLFYQPVCSLLSIDLFDDYMKVVGNWSWKLLLFCNPWMTGDVLGGQNTTLIGKAVCVCVCVCVCEASILKGWPCTLSFIVINRGSVTVSSWYCFYYWPSAVCECIMVYIFHAFVCHTQVLFPTTVQGEFPR